MAMGIMIEVRPEKGVDISGSDITIDRRDV